MSEIKKLSQKVQELQDSQADRTNVLAYPRELYPAIEAYSTQMLKVSEIHTIYVEESGNKNGKPVMVLHGGPGGGSEPVYRQYFDPEVYRIIQFDQRGCGKSTPFACLEENNTWALVEDIEKIRTLLGIDNWVIFGGSWGSTLAIAYAETHPTRVKAMVLRGIFTLRREELLFFYQKGADFLFADYFDDYLKPIPVEERGDIITAYHHRLTGSDEAIKQEAANAWTKWEMATSRLMVDKHKIERGEDPLFALAFARIENHYFVNGGFFKEDAQLINNAHIIKNIPAVIVQGRYDVVCPLKSAWELKKAWGDNADLVIIPDSGHSCSEKGIISTLVEATDLYRNL